MKNKILLLFMIACSFLLVGCGEEEVVEGLPKEKLTLDKMAELISNNNAYAGIKCDDLNEFEVIGSTSDKLLLANGGFYSLLLEKDKQYSNNQQCLNEATRKYIRTINTTYLLGQDKKLYSLYDFKATDYGHNLYNSTIRDWVEIDFTEEEKTKYKNTQKQEKGVYVYYTYAKFYVLKSDGNIYKSIYKIKSSYSNNKKTYSVVKDEIAYSANDFGHISDFSINSYGNDKTVNLIVSNKGIYTLKEILTEECQKYEDVACESKLTLIDDYSYDKYKDQIKYVDKNFVITKNNSILKTKLVFNIDNARSQYDRLFENYEQ